MTIKEENLTKDDPLPFQTMIEDVDGSESLVTNKETVPEPPRSESALNRLLNWSKKNRGNRRAIDLGIFKKYLIPSLKEFDSRITDLERMSSSIVAMDRSIQEVSERMVNISETVEAYQKAIEKNIVELQTRFDGLQESIDRTSVMADTCCRNSAESVISIINNHVEELKRQLDQTDAQVKRLTRILMKANQAFSEISEPEDVGTNFAEAFRNGYSRALENIPWLAQIRNMLGNDDSIDDSAILNNIRTLVVANITAHEVHEGDAFDPLRMCIVSREVAVESKEIGTIRIVGSPTYYTVWDDNLGEQTLEKCKVIVKVGDDDE